VSICPSVEKYLYQLCEGRLRSKNAEMYEHSYVFKTATTNTGLQAY